MKSFSDHPSTVIPWYIESEFALLANLRSDTAGQAYCAWRRGADRAIAVARSQGCDVQLMLVRLADFRDWLARENRQDDAASRRAFVIARAAIAERVPGHETSKSLARAVRPRGYRLH